MTESQLGAVLGRMYDQAPLGHKVANIHLFGIKYADIITNGRLSVPEIVRASGIRASFATEVSKGMKLARYVVPID